MSITDVRNFLDILKGTTKGELKLINIYYSVINKLIDKDDLMKILELCAKNIINFTEYEPAVTVLDGVLYGKYTSGVNFFLKGNCIPDKFGENELVSTVMSVGIFNDHYIKSDYSLPLSLKFKKFSKKPLKILIEKDWLRDDTVIGHPIAWISSYRLNNKNYCKFGKSTNGANKIANEMGLLHDKNTEILRFIFPASYISYVNSLEHMKQIKFVRPIFSDPGNIRFCVGHFDDDRTEYTRAEFFSRHGWGTTVHLGKFVAGNKEVTCYSESISTSIPLGKIKNKIKDDIYIEYLGALSHYEIGNDISFSNVLRKNIDINEMKVQIINYLI